MKNKLTTVRGEAKDSKWYLLNSLEKIIIKLQISIQSKSKQRLQIKIIYFMQPILEYKKKKKKKK